MRGTRWAFCSLTLVAVVSGVAGLSCTRVIPPATMRGVDTLAAKLARGEMLTWVGGCNDCHTPGGMYGAPDLNRRLSGSELGWQGPWGVSYAKNLTPDYETGLGKWSEQDIASALRTGVRPDGSHLLPPMPWVGYARMSDEDMSALVTYLKSVPAVSHKVPNPIPPGQRAGGPTVVIPPPPQWDAPVAPDTTSGG